MQWKPPVVRMCQNNITPFDVFIIRMKWENEKFISNLENVNVTLGTMVAEYEWSHQNAIFASRRGKKGIERCYQSEKTSDRKLSKNCLLYYCTRNLFIFYLTFCWCVTVVGSDCITYTISACLFSYFFFFLFRFSVSCSGFSVPFFPLLPFAH